ncbi:type II toxin-antitoxin system PemK/MazF family toxin [Streptomyces cacaoi]|uniref:type II toxin-antitoxin system PemK/MazF family toxin n=1 Tax=Streptomyces cacaoi TaxID=1898 RepID=UPI00261D1105|nr:type II toxin-antitoxin system PemK/MazF family toxin [Streptomyces cacaoi]
METSWWLALGAVVLLAFVAAVADGNAGRGRLLPWRRAVRLRQAAEGGAGPVPGTDGAPLPRPGEIWRTHLPDGSQRPFLVLAVRSDGVRLAPLTPEPPDPAAVPVVPREAPDGPAYLPADGRVVEAGLARLLRCTDEVDADTWERVRHLAE